MDSHDEDDTPRPKSKYASSLPSSSSSKSFSVFAQVDEMVAKPVLGTDGAMAWQQFQSNGSNGSGKKRSLGSVAPHMPMKKLDRLARGGNGDKSGHATFEQERMNEARVRKESGLNPMGAGYTNFEKNKDHQEAQERKKAEKQRLLQQKRVRPDDVPYFLSARTFEGYKKDYIFTTRSTYGTGYYWDGMDSAREAMADHGGVENSTKDSVGDDKEVVEEEEDKKERKKKKKEKKERKRKQKQEYLAAELAATASTNHPMEQVAHAIARRNAVLQASYSTRLEAANASARPTTSVGGVSSVFSSAHELPLPHGWKATVDPSSGKTYFYNSQTKETRWVRPVDSITPTQNGNQSKSTSTQRPASKEVTNSSPSSSATTAVATNPSDFTLPKGWQTAKDAKTQKIYYFHRESGRTSWEKPAS